MRDTVKRLVEGAASRSGMPRVLGLRMRGRRLILAYHNVIPSGERTWGDAALHVPISRLRAHLDVLSDTCTVVPLDTLLSEDPDRSNRPRVAITFDDAYRGAADAARVELGPRGIPVTFFVAPGLAGEPGFWWDRLAQPSSGSMPPRLRAYCLRELQGEHERVLAWAQREGRAAPLAPEHCRPAGEGELRVLARIPGVKLASHTWSHPNLVSLPHGDRREELARAAQWLGERVDGAGPWLAYPYGLSSQVVREDTAQAGHDAGLLVSGGWIPPDEPDPFAVPRLNVSAGLSPEGLGLRLAGLVPR